MTPTAVQWPEITVGGRKFTLRFAYAADYQLTRWGKTLADATVIEIAAACAGNFLPNGQWQSEGFEKAVHLADLMQDREDLPLVDAVAKAIKNRYPELEISTQPLPGKTAEATKTDSSISGPSLLPATV